MDYGDKQFPVKDRRIKKDAVHDRNIETYKKEFLLEALNDAVKHSQHGGSLMKARAILGNMEEGELPKSIKTMQSIYHINPEEALMVTCIGMAHEAVMQMVQDKRDTREISHEAQQKFGQSLERIKSASFPEKATSAIVNSLRAGAALATSSIDFAYENYSSSNPSAPEKEARKWAESTLIADRAGEWINTRSSKTTFER